MRDDRTYTVYTHRVVTEDNGPMYYVGVTYQKLSRRWKPSAYKATALEPYIIQYGWDNIEHRVFYDGLDHEMALKLEDTLIRLYRHFDCCINKQRSGLIMATNPRSYWNEWHHARYTNDVEYAERLRKYDRERKQKNRAENNECAIKERQQRRSRYTNDQEYRERVIQRNRKFSSSIEGRIYNRVKKFNYAHPDRIVETPLEAKRKYIESGGTIIPQYIKHDDL